MTDRLPPLNGLRAFEATARHLSFARAATELNVTPAALSHQVRGLEEYLGVRLFDRLNRAIRLTEAGRLLYPGIHDGLVQMRDAVGRLKRVTDDRILVISLGPAVAAKWLAPRIYRFTELYPDIDARISANLKFSDFGTEGVDVALRFGRGTYPGLYVEKLMDDAVLPLCSPRLLGGDRPLRRPEDLRHHTLLHDDSLAHFPGAPTWETWLKAMGVTDIDATRGPRFNHADHGIDAAIEGSGVVLGRTVLAAGELRWGRVVAPFDLVMPTGLAYFFVCPRGYETRPKIKAFHDWIMEEAKDFRK